MPSPGPGPGAIQAFEITAREGRSLPAIAVWLWVILALSSDGNPEFATVLRVLKALGLRLSVSPTGADQAAV